METFLRVSMLLCLLGMASGISCADTQPQTLQLLGRSTVEGYQVTLDESDWDWLRRKRTLYLGDSAPDNAPFDITASGNELEGITADVAKLLGDLLHVAVEVRRYNSRAQVIQALKAGEVDFLGTANSFEAVDPELALSEPYAQDQPMLVTRSDDDKELAPDLAGMRVAMLYHYLTPEDVRAFYPNAILQLYPSTLSAIGAVAFGQADVYLGDSISAHYLINNNYLNNVQLTDFSRMEVKSFSFALAHENQRFLRILNAALGAIPVSERMTILRRWSAGNSGMPGHQPLHFSVAEQRWMDSHPRVTVALNESFLPLSFFDEDGKFRGISADVLTRISLRTGLKFDVVRGGSVQDLIGKVKGGQANLLAAFTPSAEREDELRFTRPYLSSPYVLVSRVGTASLNTLDDLGGKRLALIRGNALKNYLTEAFPNVRIVEADNAMHAMQMVAQGKVEAAVNTLISARYMISRNYRGQLRVTSTVGTAPARIAFATDRGALELYSILDKALLSIPPEEMDELTKRWQSDVVVDGGYWLKNRAAILQGFAVAALLLLIAMAWIAYLRRLIRRRHAAESALNDQLEFMRVLIDGTPHPIYVRDRQGRLVICNSGYLDAFQTEREAVIGKTLLDNPLIDPDAAQAYHHEYLQVMEEGLPRIQDRTLTVGAGEEIVIYHWLLPYRNGEGAVIGMIAGWIDISERQRLLNQLQEAKAAAEGANRAKTTFLATMSHEIRTPMNAVIGMLELATKKAEQGILDRSAIDVASGAARGMLDLIGDILDIARIESGHLSLSPERANLRGLVESVVRIFEGLARQKGLSLVMDFATQAQHDVLVDPLRFKQIVSNLLSNAIKFTAKGQVRLSLEVLPAATPERLAIRLVVQDSGIGISAQDQQRLFSPFSQASNNTQSARSGSGLGLVISRTLCEMMGGQLYLSSTLGQGTRVEILLELLVLEPMPAGAAPETQAARPKQALNVLIIDDYPANRLLLSQQLSYLGHRVVDAEDGAQGLRAWRNETFDVVITDCNMPIMNGYALARAIRDEEHARGIEPCRILGFTANAQPDEKGRCLEAGMDDCLFKPISLEDLSERLSSVERAPATLGASESSHPAGVIDLASLEQLTRGDTASMRSLLTDLASSNREDLDRLAQVFAKADRPALADLAHRIKGGARIVNARALILACEQLEMACSAGDEAEALERAVLDVREQVMVLGMVLERLCGVGL